MGRIINIDGGTEFSDLADACSIIQEVDGALHHMMERVFPLIDMESWIEVILSHVPFGSFTTFGEIAIGLGSIKAARAVGQVISDGDIKGPVHRIIYSDGRIPGPSVERLIGEIDCSRKLDMKNRISFSVDDPPLGSLIDIQKDQSGPPPKNKGVIDKVAGMDLSSKGSIHVAAMSIMDPKGNEIGSISRRGDPPLPYISGLLFFREAPLLLPMLLESRERSLVGDDTLVVLDGNGILHPRRMGIATQIGMLTGMMTCGIAKRKMLGRTGNPSELDSRRYLAPVQEGDERIGTALVKEGSGPVYLSTGYNCELDQATKIITGLWTHRVPEPTRRAHILANKVRSSLPPG